MSRITVVNPLKESTRIATHLRSEVIKLARKNGVCVEDDLPAPRFLEALEVGFVELPVADAAWIVEIFEFMGRLQEKARQADSNYMSLHSQIESARAAYQNSREKDFKRKAQAALKVLGIKANDGTRDREIYEAYLRNAPFSSADEKVAAIAGIASRPAEVNPRLPSTYAAVYQAIKREISRRREDGEQVPATLPRRESTKAEK